MKKFIILFLFYYIQFSQGCRNLPYRVSASSGTENENFCETEPGLNDKEQNDFCFSVSSVISHQFAIVNWVTAQAFLIDFKGRKYGYFDDDGSGVIFDINAKLGYIVYGGNWDKSIEYIQNLNQTAAIENTVPQDFEACWASDYVDQLWSVGNNFFEPIIIKLNNKTINDDDEDDDSRTLNYLHNNHQRILFLMDTYSSSILPVIKLDDKIMNSENKWIKIKFGVNGFLSVFNSIKRFSTSFYKGVCLIEQIGLRISLQKIFMAKNAISAFNALILPFVSVFNLTFYLEKIFLQPIALIELILGLRGGGMEDTFGIYIIITKILKIINLPLVKSNALKYGFNSSIYEIADDLVTFTANHNLKRFNSTNSELAMQELMRIIGYQDYKFGNRASFKPLLFLITALKPNSSLLVEKVKISRITNLLERRETIQYTDIMHEIFNQLNFRMSLDYSDYPLLQCLIKHAISDITKISYIYDIKC